MTAHPLRYFNPMACFNPWQSETLTRKHWSTSRKQTTLSRSKAKSFSHPKSLSASYRKPKSGLDRQGRLRRRRSLSLSHASHFASIRSRRPEKLDSRFLARSTFAWAGVTVYGVLRFLKALAMSCSNTFALKAARVCYNTVRAHERNGPEFAAQLREAEQEGAGTVTSRLLEVCGGGQRRTGLLAHFVDLLTVPPPIRVRLTQAQ
jgi:hypothetical protein